MSQSEPERRRAQPRPTYPLRVTVGDETLRFAEVRGLTREGLPRYRPIRLERGLVSGKNGTTWLYLWLQERLPRALHIELCDARDRVVLRWRVAKALATKLQGPTFAAHSEDVALQTLELLVRGITVDASPRSTPAL